MERKRQIESGASLVFFQPTPSARIRILKRRTAETYCIQNGAVVLPHETIAGGTVVLSGGRIVHAGKQRRTPRGAEEVDAKGGYVCPGLMDIHFHGAGPYSLDPPNETSFRAIGRHLLTRGIVRFVPAMMPSEAMVAGIPALIEASGLSRRVPGIYVEGPFVNPEKRGGIQEQYVRPVDLKYLGALQRMARGRIILMTFAPELAGAEDLPRAMRTLGILPCVGHSQATCARAAAVVGRAKVNCTHLFNAMTGLDHREPGLAAFAMNRDNVWTELNPDGIHVHPELLKVVVRAKRRDRIVLISDAVVSAGEKAGEYRYMNRAVVASEAGVYYRRDRTLVGSRLLLNQGVASLIAHTGLPVHEVVRMASLNPATMLGMGKRKGSLEAGKDADVVVFQKNFAKAKFVFFAGEPLIPVVKRI